MHVSHDAWVEEEKEDLPMRPLSQKEVRQSKAPYSPRSCMWSGVAIAGTVFTGICRCRILNLIWRSVLGCAGCDMEHGQLTIQECCVCIVGERAWVEGRVRMVGC